MRASSLSAAGLDGLLICGEADVKDSMVLVPTGRVGDRRLYEAGKISIEYI